MARKQSDYLTSLLSDEASVEVDAGQAPSPPPVSRSERSRGTTLLGRESALARVASGEARQVTQLLLDPAKVRIWPGNARSYAHLSEESCRELIDSIIAEGGQKVPRWFAARRMLSAVAGTINGLTRPSVIHWQSSWPSFEPVDQPSRLTPLRTRRATSDCPFARILM